MRRLLPVLLVSACATTPEPPLQFSRAQLLDPQTCKQCHAEQHLDWSGSMHAYAADDPVFRAMNARGQRETGGKLGNFCVQCHAPMAVRDGLTKDGTNLDQLPAGYKGVTCYFCHTVASVDGAHNAAYTMGDPQTMRGSLRDPIPTSGHRSTYAPHMDRDHLDSSRFCGSCHDVVTPAGVPLERTFKEWQASVFNHAPGGTTCGQCHMPQSAQLRPAAQVDGAPLLADADAALTRLRVLNRLAHGAHLLDPAAHELLARGFDACGRMLGGWRRSLEPSAGPAPDARGAP